MKDLNLANKVLNPCVRLHANWGQDDLVTPVLVFAGLVELIQCAGLKRSQLKRKRSGINNIKILTYKFGNLLMS